MINKIQGTKMLNAHQILKELNFERLACFAKEAKAIL
jgi:hypothetical protein